MWKNLSIKWKLLILSIVGPAIVGVILSVQRVRDIEKGAVEAILSQSRSVVMMAEATRENMAGKLQMGIMKPLEELQDDRNKLMQAVPVVTAMLTAEQNAAQAGYKFRVPKVGPRNPDNEPDEVERAVLAELKSQNLAEKIIHEQGQIRYFRPIRLTQDCLFCHGDPQGSKDPMGGLKEGWKVGEIHGAFEIVSSLDKTNRAVRAAIISVAVWTLLIVFVLGGAVWMLVQFNVIGPLRRSGEMLDKVAKGDLTQHLEVDRSDELGRMASMLNNMTESLGHLLSQVGTTTKTLLTSSHELQDVSEQMATGAEETVDRSNTVASASEEMSANMNTVAAAMEEASTNVATVAAASEEMSATISDIARNADQAKDITRRAVSQAKNASKRINNLGSAANEIGTFTETISDISSQTNLLALNATIEAARAGEAGKGFAVVANEIKELAKQTAEATEEIGNKVGDIQQETSVSIEEIEQVMKVIEEVNDFVGNIANAVDEQSSATREIAENVSQASLGIQEVNENVLQSSEAVEDVAKEIAEVSNSADRISNSSAMVRQHADDLAALMDELKAMVETFKVKENDN